MNKPLIAALVIAAGVTLACQYPGPSPNPTPQKQAPGIATADIAKGSAFYTNKEDSKSCAVSTRIVSGVVISKHEAGRAGIDVRETNAGLPGTFGSCRTGVNYFWVDWKDLRNIR